MNIKHVIWMTVLSVATLWGCSVNPVTGEKELTLMSASQEVAAGEQNYRPYQQMQGGRYVVDPELTLYVNQVGQKLARVSDRPDLPYEFVVLNNGVPNAWALPGGKIAINRGLITLLDDEAQLAAVLGHEIVHAAARHSARQMTQSTLLNLGVTLAGAVTQQSDYGQWIQMGAGLGAQAWQAHYGRDQELEADAYGMKYMAKAGYDTQAAVELQQKFVELSKGQQQGGLQAWFASHPPSQERVARNQAATAEYQGGQRYAQAFQRATAQLKRDQDAYKTYEEAIKVAGSNSDQALGLLNKAIRMQPKEPLFYITKGQIQLQNKQLSEAASAFESGIKRNPEYFMGHLGYGLAQAQRKQYASAESALKSSLNLLPTEIATFQLGEVALAQNNREAARQYFNQVASGNSELAAKARAYLAEMGGAPAQ